MLNFAACGKSQEDLIKQNLLGTWEYDNGKATLVYIFDENGIVTFQGVNDASGKVVEESKGEYTLSLDENKIYIKWPEYTGYMMYTYNNKVFTLKNAAGETGYEKKNN
jgi:hypothetical protein